jgi:hypothetical protein
MYFDVLRHLRIAVRRKRLKHWRTSSWFLLQDNAPAHRSVLVKKHVTAIEHLLYFPDLVAANFYL